MSMCKLCDILLQEKCTCEEWDIKAYHAENKDPRNTWSGFEGKKHTEESRRLIGESNLGHPVSPETRKRISESKKGRKFSEEHKNSLRKVRRGKPAAWTQGPNAREIGLKISASKKGVPMKEEHRKHLSEIMKGRPATEAQKRALSQKGKKFSAEHKAKISLARKEYWRKKRALAGSIQT